MHTANTQQCTRVTPAHHTATRWVRLPTSLPPADPLRATSSSAFRHLRESVVVHQRPARTFAAILGQSRSMRMAQTDRQAREEQEL